MSMEWICKAYAVPAKRGMRVVYTGKGSEQYGTIVSAKGGYLNIWLDGQKNARPYHPTWELRYLV